MKPISIKKSYKTGKYHIQIETDFDRDRSTVSVFDFVDDHLIFSLDRSTVMKVVEAINRILKLENKKSL